MKARILSALAAVAAFLTLLGGLDLSGIINVLPPKVATGFATALPLLAGIVHLINALGDFLDDGKINGSFRSLFAVMILAVAVLSLSSCTVSFDPLSGRFGVRADPDAASQAAERLNERLHAKFPGRDSPTLRTVEASK